MPSADLNARLILRDNLTAGLRRASGGVSGFVRKVKRELFTLRAAFIGFGAVAAVRAADSVTVLENKLRAITETARDAKTGFSGIIEISRSTRTSIADNATAFQRLTIATEDMGLSQKDVLALTERLNLAIKVSGATGAEASAGMIQFAQGLASGALRGDELRSVLEQLPEVARVIAREFRVPVGQLRRLGEQGLLTADRIVTAFESADDDLRSKFARTIPTVGESVRGLGEDTTFLVNEFFKLAGISDGLVGAINAVRDAVQGATDVMRSLNEQRDIFMGNRTPSGEAQPVPGGPIPRGPRGGGVLPGSERFRLFPEGFHPQDLPQLPSARDRRGGLVPGRRTNLAVPRRPSPLNSGLDLSGITGTGEPSGVFPGLPPIAGDQVASLRDFNDELAEQQTLLAGIVTGASEVRQTFSTFNLAKFAVEDISFALTDGISDNLSAIIEGTKDVKTAFADMAKSILNDLQRIIVRTLIAKAVGALIGGPGDGAVGGASAGTPSASAAGGLFIRPGEMRNVVVHGGRHGEVIFPLGQRFNAGSAISAGGGGTTIVNMNINATDAQSFERLFMGAAGRRRHDLSTIVQSTSRASSRLSRSA